LGKLLWQDNIQGAKWIVVVSIVIVVTICNVHASTVGGESGSYLRGAAGATALAMGGANSAYPQYLASWWNPAVIAMYKERHASTGIGLRSLGRTSGSGSFAFRIPPRVGLGLDVLYRGDPFIGTLYDEDDKEMGSPAYTTLTGKIGLSYMVTRSVNAGIGINILYQSLPDAFIDGALHYTTTSAIGAFDLAVTYELSKNLRFAAILKYIGAEMQWDFGSDHSLGRTVQDKPLPALHVGSRYETAVLQRPFIWTSDIVGYFFDGDWKRLIYPEAAWNNGAEWRYWETFYVRAGIGDVVVNRNLAKDFDEYAREFSMRISAGLSYNLSRLHENVWLNYGIATDKVWAGVDQQLDLTITF